MAKRKRQEKNKEPKETEGPQDLEEPEEETKTCKDVDYYLGEFDAELRLFSPLGCRNCATERAKRYFDGTVNRVVAQECSSFKPI